MLDSKLVESIKLLSQGERSEFASFLDSRFFQKEFSIQQLKQLLKIILEALHQPEKPELSKKEVHSIIFQQKEFAEKRLDRIMFELNRLLKVFLLVKNYLQEDNELQQSLDWLAIQRHRGQEVKIEKQFEKLRKDVDSQNKTSAEKYLAQFKIAQEEHEWQSTYNKGKGDLGLPNAVEALDFYYFTLRLEMTNRFLLQQRLTTVDPPIVIQLSFKTFNIPEYYLKKSAVLSITHKVHQLLSVATPDVAGFEELLTLLNTHEEELPPVVLSEFYVYLRNYGALLINEGYTEFDLLLHELQRDNLKRGYFYYEGKIQPNALLSIIQQAIRVNKIDWAWEFVQNHKGRIIGENESHDFSRMGEALCLFAEKKFYDALLAIPFGSTHTTYHLMARRLELKIYYELHSEILPSKIDAFKMFINRTGNKTFSKSLAELFTNFGNFVYQLSLSIPGDKKRSELLIKRIQAKKQVAERSWLLEKAREIGETRL